MNPLPFSLIGKKVTLPTGGTYTVERIHKDTVQLRNLLTGLPCILKREEFFEEETA